ncbi:MAG: hypothetical protein HW396_197 [Candidatus Dadabacteria bacterium]|jgi:hypothetical protein|nr:hypothetical protein [Candidatus Dadabacteria bacterium]
MERRKNFSIGLVSRKKDFYDFVMKQGIFGVRWSRARLVSYPIEGIKTKNRVVHQSCWWT